MLYQWQLIQPMGIDMHQQRDQEPQYKHGPLTHPYTSLQSLGLAYGAHGI